MKYVTGNSFEYSTIYNQKLLISDSFIVPFPKDVN
jgi:hypothetical protein